MRFVALLIVGLTLGAVSPACGGEDKAGTRSDSRGDAQLDDATVSDAKDTSTRPETAQPDTVSDTAQPDTVADTTPTCTPAGTFGCPCSGNDQCLDELCIEGPDGGMCTRGCVRDCPDGFACLNTSIGGNDPIAICVPRHTRLCRPCEAQSDCQNPLDPNPAHCVAVGPNNTGTFCASSCETAGCPSGYGCETLEIEGVARKLCLPESGECSCRDSWAGLGFTTTCSNRSEAGTCTGTRTCGANGLTACSAGVPSAEVCDGADNDCDGTVDNIVGSACQIENSFGSCEGVTTCDAAGEEICQGRAPADEVCNGVDDNCDGTTDERWDDCAAATCLEVDGLYTETGAPRCESGHCGYGSPRPCGAYTCELGGADGDRCATACTDDTFCTADAFCEVATGRCVANRIDGASCARSEECASGHCQNGTCCEDGDCCARASDCPASYRAVSSCGDAASCQGTRRDATCSASMCGTTVVDDDAGCTSADVARTCGAYQPRVCTGASEQTQPTCPTSCVADSECAAGYHCDGTCVPDVSDGGSCDEATDCSSGHCQNGFCCSGGDCCVTAGQCPASYRDDPACGDSVTCQGARRDATCVANRCGSRAVDDDSACDSGVLAKNCAPYRARYCDGATTQFEPQCPTSCVGNADCMPGFHCDGTCVQDVPNGGSCSAAIDCASGHCQNGFCCASGDCCTVANDCPASYASAPVCDSPTECQGTRKNAQCQNNMCRSQTGVGDDSACGTGQLANACGLYPDRFCTGAVNQPAPACATSCASDAECDANAFCDRGACVAKRADGATCSAEAQCTSAHCQNGFCCSGGDCCARASDCSAAVYGQVSSCDSPTTCQGSRRDPACVGSVCQLGASPVGDDSGCAGQVANDCGYYKAVSCTSAANQSAPSCPTSCSNSNQCDAGAYCAANNTCQPLQGAGTACSNNSQCGSGLQCVDGVCCSSACGGTCQACNVPGSEGVCQNVPRDSDPASECGAVSCTGYYAGFTGSTCYARANVPAAGASCNGSGQCQGATDLCPVAARGAATVTCDPTCEEPVPGSCSGTTPGACRNITGGTQSCGVGACTRTVDRCLNGAPQACVPGLPSAEICDGIDNDCDGLVDSADPTLVRPSCENQDGVCAGAKKEARLCVGGNWGACDAGAYSAHTTNYETTETRCDGLDNNCDGAADNQLPAPNNPNQQGMCSGSKQQCRGVLGWAPDYSSVPGYGLPETPDGSYLDENCDGIDGDVNLGWFVIPLPLLGQPCSQSQPCSLSEALGKVTAAKPHIYMRTGTYSGPVVVTKVAELYGGYSASDWKVRRSRDSAGAKVEIKGAVLPSSGGHTAALRATGVGTSAKPIVIADLFIQGVNATAVANNHGPSSYGVFSKDSFWRFERVTVVPAQGAAGAEGANGAGSGVSGTAPTGGVGEDGNNSAQSCSTAESAGGGAVSNSSCGGTGSGGGGKGGSKDTSCTWGVCTSCNARPGYAGGAAGVSSGGYGRGGSAGGTCGSNPPGTGGSGWVRDGSGGGGNSFPYGLMSAEGFLNPLRGGDGTLGEHGGGGGGGGGAGGCDSGTDSRGGGGGGGGAGGCRATAAGTGGYSGGGSFGLFTYGGGITVVGPSLLKLGLGGAGGRGGNGGVGQNGGAGGRGGAAAGGSVAGAYGGAGGHGGHSGAGGGGAGGLTVAVMVVSGAWATTGTVTYDTASPPPASGGTGGTGGIAGSAGANGPVGNVKQCTVGSPLVFLNCP